jgi:hypothetical protein
MRGRGKSNRIAPIPAFPRKREKEFNLIGSEAQTGNAASAALVSPASGKGRKTAKPATKF